MKDIECSVLLERILDRARNRDGETVGAITAEKIIVSALEMLTGKAGPLSEEEREELKPFSEYFASRGIRPEEIQAKLGAAVEKRTDMDFAEFQYWKGKLLEARALANEQQLEAVPAGMLLLLILREPNPALKRCLEEEGPSEKEEKKEEPEKTEEQASQNEEEHPFAFLLQSIEEKRQSVMEALGIQFSDSAERQDTQRFPGSDTEKTGEDRFEGTALPEEPKERISSLVDIVKRTQGELLKRVFGQDNAVTVFASGYFQGELISLLERDRKRPRATFLFAGPPGVGKTFLAETAADVLGLPFNRFDMSEYADQESVNTLCGGDKMFMNSKPGLLTGFVSEHPKCLLLFDEIEKAHRNVIHLFLQILDAGRLRDAYTGEEVSFADTIVLFTTNAGKQLYEDSLTEDMSGISRKVILKALEKDVNPLNGLPFFPPAICSRFASGNVVMFNYLSARDLREIAKSTITELVVGLESVVGIHSDVEDDVYTALLLSEGGGADARMIRGRAQAFFNQELYELLRLIDSEKAKTGISDLERVRFTVQLPESNKEIRKLFETPDDTCALVFAAEKDVEWCRDKQSSCRILGTQNSEEGKALLQDNDVQFVMLDLDLSPRENKEEFLNLEDIESDARSFLWYVREKHASLPVYLLVRKDVTLSLEEQLSFRRNGVQDFIGIEEEEERFAEKLKTICEGLHHQQSIVSLGRSNKLVNFETGQRLSEDGKEAEICLFDFEYNTAVDAEDRKNVLSSVSRPNVHFSDVVGAKDAKKELMYFADRLRNPKQYAASGTSALKGILLYGPPGTGKTMLAKALACEADVTFLTAEGNQFLKKYVGEGPASVHELFRAARKYAPSILFIDEIDAIAKRRTGSEQSEAREEILTSFLTEMDGFRVDLSRPVFVLAATNFSVDQRVRTALDPALLRRFSRRILVDLPNKEDRILYMRRQFDMDPIFRVSDRMLENLAVRSTGMSLSELESVLEMAQRLLAQDGGDFVDDKLLEEAFETFNSGEVKKWDPSELERTARHESGHALLSWLSGDKPSYLTIIARSDYAGYMQHGDNESKGTYTKDEMLSRIRTALGGRAAELVYYGEKDGLSSGAGGDLKTATTLAKRMICAYGMVEDFGLAVVEPDDANTPEIRKAVNRILTEQLEEALSVIGENRSKLDALVRELMDNNSLTGDKIDAVLAQA